MLKNAALFHISRTLFKTAFIKAASRSAFCALLSVTALALPAAAGAQAPSGPQAPLPTTQLAAGIHIIRAEVANTEATRRDGLMFRKELPGNDGMLFLSLIHI